MHTQTLWVQGPRSDGFSPAPDFAGAGEGDGQRSAPGEPRIDGGRRRRLGPGVSQRRRLPPGLRHCAARGTRTSRFPTARMVAKSKAGAVGWREPILPAARRATQTWLNPQARAASLRKARFFATGSSRVTESSGKAIFRAKPGKPAPLPMSSRVPWSCTCRARKRLSPKWRVTHSSGSRMAVRLIFWFQRSSRWR